jgi:hypothetical protein
LQAKLLNDITTLVSRVEIDEGWRSSFTQAACSMMSSWRSVNLKLTIIPVVMKFNMQINWVIYEIQDELL